jgi:chromate transporter
VQVPAGPAVDAVDSTDADPAATRASPSLATLFLSFLRLGSTAYGGPAMVSEIGDMAVQRKHWLDNVAFSRGVALCQMIPGATAMQTAAYVGLRTRGVAGGLAAYAGFGLPAFCVMLALAALYAPAHRVPVAVSLFLALRAVVVAIVANAAVNFTRSYLRTWVDFLIAAAAAVALAARINPLWVIACSGLAGSLCFRKAARLQGTPPPPRAGTWRPLAVLLGGAALALAALFVVSPRLLVLAISMLRIDLFAFGGGFASLPLMQHQAVEVSRWLDGRAFADGVALGQVTPGPIVITATFVGYVVGSVPGALVATLAILFPSFVVLVVALPSFDRLQASPLVRGAIRGALSSFVGLLVAVAWRFSAEVSWEIPTVLLACAAFAALRLRVHALWLVLGAGVVAVWLG